MSDSRIEITTPVGRIIKGNPYDPQTTDYDGNPLKVKSGPNMGADQVRYYIGVAFPKTPGATHWAQEPFLRPIYDLAAKLWPNKQYEHPAFSWKIHDGDSSLPDKKGVPWNTKVGHPGNWVVGFSSGFAPRVVNADGSAALLEPGAIKTGYYVQVYGTVDSNSNVNNPGMYINLAIVSLQGYGPEIVSGPDPKAVGFGGAALPPGATRVPVGGLTPGSGPAPLPPPGQSPAFTGAILPPNAVAALPPMPRPGPTAVMPHPGILSPPAAPPPPALAAPPPPAPPRGPVMTAKAGGISFNDYIAKGWSVAQLVQHGMMEDDNIPF